MRLWSLHPKYLDAKGLTALWREALLAKHVLEGRTKGYTHHPQLDRFKAQKNPLDAINQYLSEVYAESLQRNYLFNKEKIEWRFKKCIIPVTAGQMQFEAKHLLNKLAVRDSARFNELHKLRHFDPHPAFTIIAGAVEKWEVQ